jgi:phosphate starvation-inducible PhoH-like protein
MAQAISFLLAKRVSRIILARPAVEAGEKLGFLPGDMQEKVDPYLRPMYDALADLMSYDKMRRYIELGVIEEMGFSAMYLSGAAFSAGVL